MRLSELLDAPVFDDSGRRIGVLRDLRVRREPGFPVAEIVVGQPGALDRAAHVWGFAAGRAAGPWPLRKLTARAVRRARVAPVEVVGSWGPLGIMLTVPSAELRALEATPTP
jgi:hypothetical protein